MKILDIIKSLILENKKESKKVEKLELDFDQIHSPRRYVMDVESGEIIFTRCDAPHYPPYDYGFPSSSIENMIGQHKVILDRISGLSLFYDDKTSDSISRLIYNYVSFVNGLPATYQGNNYGAVGLLNLSLNVAFLSLKATHGDILSSESEDIRMISESRWRIAIFIAGLTCELNRTTLMIVKNTKGQQWNPYELRLTDWLAETKSEIFWVAWLSTIELNNQNNIVSFMLRHIIPADIIAYIFEDRRVVEMMLNAISGEESYQDNPIKILIENARYKAIDADILNNQNFLSKS